MVIPVRVLILVLEQKMMNWMVISSWALVRKVLQVEAGVEVKSVMSIFLAQPRDKDLCM